MRLTIRTLLGYMDDILDKQDAEEIGKRIEESEVATTLYHRVRDVTRRLSLKAPDLDGNGLDPNTVAEYLDNLLPDDRVPDFEKICLDSDMHLAEVAACHQVLAVALGEPAEIDPSSREHMYQLPQVAADLANLDRPPKDPLGVMMDENSEPGTNIPKRPSPVVPDYLRERARRLPMVPMVMGGIVVVCIVIVVLAISGVFGPIGINPSEEVAQNGGQTQTAENGEETVDPNAPGVNPGEDNQPGDDGQAIVPPDLNEAFLSTPEVSDDGTMATENPPIEGSTSPDTTDIQPFDTIPNIPGVIGDVSAAPSSLGNNLGPNPVPENPTDLDATVTEATPPETTTETEPVEPEEPSLIGLFVSENQALVQLDPADKSWKVIPQQGVLTYPTPLAALPTFRPIIATASGLSVQLLSDTQVTMQPTQSDAMPVLKLQYGRIVLRSLGKPNLRLLLTIGNKTGIVTLVNPNSAVAVELTFHREIGTDPLEVPSGQEINFFAISGTLLWEKDSHDEPLKIDASERVTFITGEKTPKIEVLAALPSWINVPTINKLDQNASAKIFKAFSDNPIVSLALREQLGHRQREVSRLALKSLTQLGQLEAAVASLDNADERLTWDQTIKQLVKLASQSPEMAEQVHQAFEREYDVDATDLLRMLWGYTPKQLENDGAIQLVEHLDHDRLVFRVMSFYNLKKITGRTLYFEPWETPARRRRPAQRWQGELKKGKVIPKEEK